MVTDDLLVAIAEKLGIRTEDLKALASAKSPTFAELAAPYDEHAKEYITSWPSRRDMFFAHVLPFWGPFRVGDLSLVTVDEYRQRRKREPTYRSTPPCPATINREISMVHACLEWGILRKMIRENPIHGWNREPEAPRPDWYLTEDLFQRWLSAARGQFKLVSILAFDTGMRRDEIRLLTLDEFRSADGCIVLGKRTKTRRARTIPLTDRALDAVRIAVGVRLTSSPYVFVNDNTERPWSTAWIQSHTDRVKEKCGFPEFVCFHTLRHSFASRMSVGGMNMQQLMARGGWTSAAAFRYQHLESSPEAIEASRKIMQAKIDIDLRDRKPPQRADVGETQENKLTGTKVK